MTCTLRIATPESHLTLWPAFGARLTLLTSLVLSRPQRSTLCQASSYLRRVPGQSPEGGLRRIGSMVPVRKRRNGCANLYLPTYLPTYLPGPASRPAKPTYLPFRYRGPELRRSKKNVTLRWDKHGALRSIHTGSGHYSLLLQAGLSPGLAHISSMRSAHAHTHRPTSGRYTFCTRTTRTRCHSGAGGACGVHGGVMQGSFTTR